AHYLKNQKPTHDIDNEGFVLQETGDINFDEDFITAEELYRILNGLPAGNRMVFNLYAIEGFKHKEIASKLNIDANTSRSLYNRAKLLIRKKLESAGKPDTGNTDNK
ncbi:MAG: RNA polymerase sigma factor, partial [Bacteroidales bacterium]